MWTVHSCISSLKQLQLIIYFISFSLDCNCETNVGCTYGDDEKTCSCVIPGYAEKDGQCVGKKNLFLIEVILIVIVKTAAQVANWFSALLCECLYVVAI